MIFAGLTLALAISTISGSEVVFEESTQEPSGRSFGNGTRSGKNLLSWLNSFGSSETDPYLAKSNSACLEGDLAECFKAKALASLDDFFVKDAYELNTNARVIRMPDEQLRRLQTEPYEFSSLPKTEEPEWDQFVKFLTRKVERFLKSAAIEVKFDDDITDSGRYSPRFIDEISSELDTIEDKKASLFSKAKVKKLLIPLLIMVKLFKLKLLLFLPLILGLASFKKFLGFLAIAIPGLIGFFKLCKPDLHHNYGGFGHSNFYHRPPHQFAVPANSHYEYRSESPSAYQYLQEHEEPLYQYPANSQQSQQSIAFREDAHKLAYNSYNQKKK